MPSPVEYIKISSEFYLAESKTVICVKVKKADNLFYIKEFGRSSKGCYMRIGTSIRSMTDEQVVNSFFLKSINKQVINIESHRQNWQFGILKTRYIEKHIQYNDDTFLQNYNLLTKDNKFNILAELLSDENDISLKLTRFNGLDKTELIENTEYGYVCLLVAIDRMLVRLEALNITKSTINDSLRREDKKLIDSRCLREAFLNCIIHNDWIDGTPPAVYVFNDRIEIISTGGLPTDLTIDEFYAGISKPRNKELMRILRDLDYVEQSGFGIRKIISVYGKEVFKISDNFVRVILPFDQEVLDSVLQFCNDNNKTELSQSEQIIIDYISRYGFIRRSNVEDILNIKKTRAIKIINELTSKGLIYKGGNSIGVKYFKTK